MAEGFTKLFNTIITSTIWQEDDKTRLLWITMLALADFEGNVSGSLPGIAYQAHISIEDCEKALKKLSEPDKYSRSKEHKGRRIQEIEGGWQILNYIKYRSLKVDRKAYLRKKQREHRKKESSKEKIKTNNTHTNTHTHRVNKLSTVVNSCQQLLTYTIEQAKDACIVNGISEINAQSYFDHFNAQGWVRANGQPIKNLQSHVKRMWDAARNRWVFDEKKHQQPETIHEQAERLRKAGEL